jgi:hypothetical protein
MIKTRCTPQGATQVSIKTEERHIGITHTGNKACEVEIELINRRHPTIVKLNMTNDGLIELRNGIVEYLDKSTRGPIL